MYDMLIPARMQGEEQANAEDIHDPAKALVP